MDLTLEFRNILAEQQTKLERSDDINNNSSPSVKTKPKNLIMKPVRKESPFIASAFQIYKEIMDLSEEVAEYISAFVRYNERHTTEEDDMALQKQLKQAANHIDILNSLMAEKEEGGESDQSNHSKAHYHCIIMFLYERVAEVTRQFESVRMLKMEKIRNARKLLFGQGDLTPKGGARRSTTGTTFVVPVALQQEYEEAEAEDEEIKNLSEDQVHLLEEENHMLHTDLNFMVDQAREAEIRAMEVGQLLQLFNSKVDEQYAQIEQLYNEALTSTENIKSGNTYLDKTRKRGSFFRKFVVMTFMIASFGLLFLHWLN